MITEIRNDIWAALESTTDVNDRRGGFAITARQTPNSREVMARRDSLMRFLEEIDGDLSVGEVRDALESWES